MASKNPAVASNEAQDNGEDDYMSMVITEPEKEKEKETYTQRRIRKQREAELKGRPKSKAELRAEEAAARDAGLSTTLPTNNKGFKMMKMMGFTEGSALGKTENARTEPLGIVVKEDRGGIGLDSEKKRKFREEVESEAKKVKADEGEYRERVRKEREERRLEGLVHGAQKVLEKLETEDEEHVVKPGAEEIVGLEGGGKRTNKVRLTKQINVLWRGVVRHREVVDRERRMRYDLHQSHSRLPTYNDPDEDKDDKRALGKDGILEESIEEEDPELEEFNALEPAEKLGMLVGYLRGNYHYCFWCKFRYLDESMDGCPGVSEEDHD